MGSQPKEVSENTHKAEKLAVVEVDDIVESAIVVSALVVALAVALKGDSAEVEIAKLELDKEAATGAGTSAEDMVVTTPTSLEDMIGTIGTSLGDTTEVTRVLTIVIDVAGDAIGASAVTAGTTAESVT